MTPTSFTACKVIVKITPPWEISKEVSNAKAR